MATGVDKILHCSGTVVYMSASSSAIEFSCLGRFNFSFPLTLSW